jgi:16S rRNA (cytidine1402-2'-O)-methyltransferase
MSKLYLVPTPVGNLEDMTFRAVRILKEVSLILAEDTRKTGLLLKHFNIENKMQSHHQHNEHQTAKIIAQRIESGQTVALVTDAGTPGISDPGFLLIRTCIEEGIEVECLPGATAFVPALVASGLPCDRFYFEGFLPHKKGRNTRLTHISSLDQTIILYESPFRLAKTLSHLAEFMGDDRKACVSREISKFYEEHKRGTLKELSQYYSESEPKGEIVITISGRKPD